MNFAEYTVQLEWENSHSGRYGSAEVMVHMGEDDRILRAYTYRKDVVGIPRRYRGKASLNPLFVYLTPEFISEFRNEILEQVAEEVAEKVANVHKTG